MDIAFLGGYMPCRRCGMCCRATGPTLRQRDVDQLRSGGIAVQHLVCVRQGELAWDPRSRSLRPVAGEMLKIRGQGQSWMCIFYDPKERACQRYFQRPAECVAFDCDAPDLLMELLNEPPLTRAVLVQPGSALEAIVGEHESSFPAANAVAWARNPKTRSQAWVLARQEGHFRAALAQRLGVGDDVLWPYLGRPLRYIVDAVAGGSSFLGALPTDELGPHRG